jgi:putative acetyltransferase
MLNVRPEHAEDGGAIRAVHLAAFGQPDEADLVEALRESGDAVLSVVAEDRGRLVGHVLFSRLSIHTSGDRIVPALALAPMAVAPERQRQGIGSALLTEAIRECRVRGERVVIVVGHLGFYPRFGFSRERAVHLDSEFQCEAFMALELEPGVLSGLSGRVEYARAFGRFV